MDVDRIRQMGLRLRGEKLLKVRRCREWRIVPYEHRDVLPLLRQIEGRFVTVAAMRAVLQEVNARITELNAKVNATRAKKDATPPALLRAAIPHGSLHGYVETEEGSLFTSFDIIDGIVDVAKETEEEQINTETGCAEK